MGRGRNKKNENKKKKRKQQKPKEQRKVKEGQKVIIDVTEASESVNQTTEDSPAALISPKEEPILECTLAVFEDRVQIENLDPAIAEVRNSRFIGIQQTTLVSPLNESALLTMHLPWAASVVRSPAFEWAAKWRDRLLALILWLIFPTYLFADNGLIGTVLQFLGGSPSWEGIVLVIVGAFLIVYLTARGVKAFLYVAFLPIILLFWSFAKVINTARLVVRVAKTIGAARFGVANTIMMIACCMSISKTNTSGLLWAAMAYLVFGMFFLTLSNFYWVTSPLRTVFLLISWADKESTKQMGNFKNELSSAVERFRNAQSGLKKRKTKKAKKTLVKLLGSIGLWYGGAELLKSKLKQTSSILLFYIFAFRFLVSLAIVVSAFGAIFLAIAKMHPDAFTGSANVRSFSDALYFSVGTFFTSSFGDIVPVTTLAKLTVVFEMGMALLMLTFLALSFSALAQQTTTAAADRVETRTSEILSILVSEVGAHFRVEGASFREVFNELKKNPGPRLK